MATTGELAAVGAEGDVLGECLAASVLVPGRSQGLRDRRRGPRAICRDEPLRAMRRGPGVALRPVAQAVDDRA
jgi:hypothetical protein